jgi:hypothetical protein
LEDFEEERWYEEDTLEKKYVVENEVVERVQLMDFDEKEA